MFSVMYTGICCLPLWIAIVMPTKSGSIVERRDQVLIGRLSEVARAASTFFNRWSSTNGPFLTERAMVFYPLLFLPLFLIAAGNDHARGAFVAARAEALGRRAPRTARIAAR